MTTTSAFADTITFRCPACRTTGAVPPEHAGRKVRCRSCRGAVRVPGGKAPPAAPPTTPCLDCGIALRPGIERCGRCAAEHVSPAGRTLRLVGSLALATAGWAVLFAIGAAVFKAGGLVVGGHAYSGRGPALLVGLPGIALLYASDHVRRFRGAPRWAEYAPGIPLPVLLALGALFLAVR